MNAIALTISNTPIRQDSLGRYCLNDLHKAAGGASKHQPAFFIRRDETKELVTELSSADSQNINPIQTIQGKGKAQGTYAVKELVYAYAMWISAKFHIAVIRAYDSLVNSMSTPSNTITEQEALIFKRSIEMHCKEHSDSYGQLYRKVYDYFGITSYKLIPAGKLDEAIRLLGIKKTSIKKPNPLPPTISVTQQELDDMVEERAKVLSGELLEKEPKPALMDKAAMVQCLREEDYVVIKKDRYMDDIISLLLAGINPTYEAQGKRRTLN